MANPPAIQIQNLRKTYARKGRPPLNALDGLSFDVGRGEFIGLLGPNGAGKTTLVKCLTTLLIPDGGSACVLGHDVSRSPQAVRSLIGWMNGGERTLYWKLSSVDNLRYFGALYGIPGKETDRRIRELLDIMGLWDRRHEALEKFSTGLRQKISIARALLHDPQVLFLDEPTLGLDPTFSRFIRSFLKEKINRAAGKTVLLTTHNMIEAEELCDRILLINHGRILAQGTPAELKKQVPVEQAVEVHSSGDIEKSWLEALPGADKVSVSKNDGVTVVRLHGREPQKLLTHLLRSLPASAQIQKAFLSEPSLEDVFIHLTGQRLDTDEN